jgi:heat-inducible transcriptional repressor
MVRIVDHENRKNQVLAFTISTYIGNGQPVSSQVLADHFGLSSATMRNILAELEDDGYLYHPHTSAGKVPSNKGYRYYVDFLMSIAQMPQEQRTSILNAYRNPASSLEDLLEKTSDILADLTHYTSLVSLPDIDDRIYYRGLSNLIQQPEFHDIRKLAVLLRLLEEKKELLDAINKDFKEPMRVYIGEEIGCPLGDTCSLIVSTYSKGRKLKGRLAVLGPRRMSYEHAVSALEFISQTLNDILEKI